MAYIALPNPTNQRFSTVVLSAGCSSRLAGTPKATLAVGSEPAVTRVVRISEDLGAVSVVVVVGIHEAEVRAALQGTRAVIVRNGRWEEGRTGSIQLGLSLIPSELNALLWPVDHPFVESGTVEDLLAAAAPDRLSLWFIPEFLGRGGHPVLLRPELRDRVDELSAATPLRSLLPKLGIYVRRVPVEDPGVVATVDSPGEYVTALRAWRLRQGGPE